MIKSIATRKRGRPMVRRYCLQFPKKHWPLTTVKRPQRKIDDIAVRGTVNIQVASGRKRKVIIKQKYSIISVKCC